MANFLARRIAFFRPGRGSGRDARLLRAIAALFVCIMLTGCAPRGSMDFRIANLETRVMELEEQNRRQASQLDARLDRLERFAVAEGVENDRIRAAIAASRSDLHVNSGTNTAPQTEPQDEAKAAEGLAAEVVASSQSGDAEYAHPVSRPTPRSVEPAVAMVSEPDTPYTVPSRTEKNSVQASTSPAPQPAVRHKPTGNELPYAYTEAVRLTRSGNTEKGRQMLRAFIMEYPDSPLVPNAYYWLGETYYHDKRYAQAILTFKEVTSRFPKDPKAAASMLKIGYSYEMLGDKDNARFYLNALAEDYPKSEPARLARAALDERL